MIWQARFGFVTNVAAMAPALPTTDFVIIPSGDMQAGSDIIILSGDEQSGTDGEKLSGDMQS